MEKKAQSDPEWEEDGESGVLEKKRVQKPRLYKVFLHNDDYTTMEFVIHVLQRYFFKDLKQAEQIMLKVHHEGRGLCGMFTHEVAETKVNAVLHEAKRNGHPLLCTMEPE